MVYLDTSALAKWYLNETHSDEVEAFIREHAPLAVSSLTVVEMRCLLARRRRQGDFTEATETRVFAAFQEDIRRGHLVEHAIGQGGADGAVNLIGSLPHIPLRTLDALHLAIAWDIGADAIATADRVMAAAAEEMEIPVEAFFPTQNRSR